MANPEAIAKRLVRINAHLFGGVLALLFAGSLFFATLVLHLQGGTTPGQMLGLLSHFFPGYEVSLGGAIIGGLWGALAGYATGYVLGRAYGPWMLRGANRALDSREGEIEGAVLELRALPFATVSASLLAGALFLATNWLFFRYGQHPSPHLELLANYLPGFSSDFVGSFIGAFWLFLYAFVAAFGVAWIYDRVVLLRSSASS